VVAAVRAGPVRLSFHLSTTGADVDRALAVLGRELKKTFASLSIRAPAVRRVGRAQNAAGDTTPEGDTAMRYMMIVKATPESEAGDMPPEGAFEEMAAYNEELVKAGVLLAGEGLHPSSAGARVAYDGDKRTVTDGPFAETKELVAGFWLIQVGSPEEAIEWAKRVPFREGELEVRRVYETADFGDALSPELAAREDELRNQLSGN
jgi:hypothetical protein